MVIKEEDEFLTHEPCCEELEYSNTVVNPRFPTTPHQIIPTPQHLLMNIAAIRHKLSDLSLFFEELDFSQLVAITGH